jgi:hypothetical protein
MLGIPRARDLRGLSVSVMAYIIGQDAAESFMFYLTDENYPATKGISHHHINNTNPPR